MKIGQLGWKFILFGIVIGFCIGGIVNLEHHMNPNYYILEIISQDLDAHETKMLIELNKPYEIKNIPFLSEFTLRIYLFSGDSNSYFVILLISKDFNEYYSIKYLEPDRSVSYQADSGSLNNKIFTFSIRVDLPKTYIVYFAVASVFLFFYFNFIPVIEWLKSTKLVYGR